MEAILSNNAYKRVVLKANLFILRYGSASEAALARLFPFESPTEPLCGVGFSTWEPEDYGDTLLNVWQLSEEATFDNFREIYLGDDEIRRVMYCVAVDASEICTVAVEKYVLQMEKHKKAKQSELNHFPILIVITHDGGPGVDEEQTQKLTKIAERVSASLMFVDKSNETAMEYVKTVIVRTLYPKGGTSNANQDDAMVDALLSQRGTVMTEEMWSAAEKKNVAMDDNAREQEHNDLIRNVDELMQKAHTHQFDVDEEDESRVCTVADCRKCDDIQQQEHVWLDSLETFVVEVTREGTGSAPNSPQKEKQDQQQHTPAASLSLTADAATEDDEDEDEEEEDAAAFFQDLLDKK